MYDWVRQSQAREAEIMAMVAAIYDKLGLPPRSPFRRTESSPSKDDDRPLWARSTTEAAQAGLDGPRRGVEDGDDERPGREHHHARHKE